MSSRMVTKIKATAPRRGAAGDGATIVLAGGSSVMILAWVCRRMGLRTGRLSHAFAPMAIGRAPVEKGSESAFDVAALAKRAQRESAGLKLDTSEETRSVPAPDPGGRNS